MEFPVLSPNHLVLYGVTEETRRSVQRWIAEQWNGLICSRSSPKDRANHLRWHLRDGSTRSGGFHQKADNMQEIRDFAGYFSEYLGKDEKAQAAREPIPSRWWGKVNKQNIPWAEMRDWNCPCGCGFTASGSHEKSGRKWRMRPNNSATCGKWI